MITLRTTAICFCVLAFSLAGLNTTEGALPIEIEVAMEPGIPLAAPQEWAQRLGKMGLANVRLRGIRPGDQPRLEVKKLGTLTRYHLLAILNKRNELALPKRRYRVRDLKALEKYLQQLPSDAAHNAEERGRFGLTEKQFRQVFAELSQPVGFSTKGKSVGAILRQLEKTLTVPVVRLHNAQLGNSAVFSTELQELSTGTALAITLRSAGLVIRPEQQPGKTLRLTIDRYNNKIEAWPTGWKPGESPRRLAPQLYEARNIELGGFTLSQTLTALQPALQLPVILDNWILEQEAIDPNTIQISLPKKRTFLKSAVGKILSQARLTVELRVDEQEQPFLWVTQFGKNSRPATD